nr:MAG TPA: hypothetical protein [Bacteriophage sp.]
MNFFGFWLTILLFFTFSYLLFLFDTGNRVRILIA